MKPTTGGPDLLALVAERLAARQVRCALVGPAAHAAHGVTVDDPGADCLVVSPAALAESFWEGLPGVRCSVGPAAPDARFTGTATLSRGAESVHVRVGKMSWQQDVLARARVRRVGGAELPVAGVVDLILLGLYCGEEEDAKDIERLLEITDRESIVEVVDGRMNQLPPECARLWRRILTGR